MERLRTSGIAETVHVLGGLRVAVTRRALVLGGGGLAGIAWQTGVLCGVTDVSPVVGQLLLNSDVLVGTSAGAAVAAQISSGCGLDVLFAQQISDVSAEFDPDVSIDVITALFRTAMTESQSSLVQRRQRIGAAALAAETVSEERRRQVISQRLPSLDWPDRVLRITAVDVASGELVVFDRDSGVELVDAVTASCAVPGAWPPATIANRRYIDGGTASLINLGTAADCDVAVVLVPASATAPSPFGGGAAVEIAGFGGSALSVFADDAALAAFGPNPLDPGCRIASAMAGREQGRRQAGEILRFLGG
ncbi:MAG: patatin-like phospholipase family protein [Mycobacteriaceae bacterium]|nr:patatin-like phospholipase family protein [Mycobacteriaceae bacterium]